MKLVRLNGPASPVTDVPKHARAPEPDAATLTEQLKGERPDRRAAEEQLCSLGKALVGAENFLTKPVDMGHLVAAVEKAAEKSCLRRENVEFRARLTPSVYRGLVRYGAFAALIVASALIGRLIGGSEAERPVRPIPVPFDRDTAITNAPAPPGLGPDTERRWP